MSIKFYNLEKRFEGGMKDFLDFHGMAELSYEIEIEVTDNDKVSIDKEDNRVKFSIGEPYQVYRALTILKQHLRDKNFIHSEKCYFTMGGPMFDGSQASSLMNIESVKKMLLILAGMGFNMMMLYCEDCYEIEGEPYFGNMRPRYSEADFKLLDDYAYSLGIELVPCIQTLGHLPEMIKRPPYYELSDTGNVLLVGEEKVYEFIDKMLYTMAKCFRSKRIHIGLDEAWGLGLGRYLQKNGYRPATQIMAEHVQRVYSLTKKYDFEPMMWGDMFFRAKSKNGVYYDPDIRFDEADKASVPDGMSLIYWDYYNFDVEHYEQYIDKTKLLSDNVVFAGCARNVRTFGCHYKKGELTTNAAMTACKKKGIKEFIATVWGDNHRESSNFAILPQLQRFAEHMYSAEVDENSVPKRFEACVNVEWDAMMIIDKFDAIPGYTDENRDNIPVSKVLMWQNILMGLFDANLGEADFQSHYAGLMESLKQSTEKYPDFAYMFEFYYELANTLKDKAEIGIRLAKAYRSNDLEKLKALTNITLTNLMESVKKLRLAHRRYFYTEYKPVGWEILDVRYGGLIMGIDTAIARLTDFLDKKIDRVEELEEERLSFSGEGTMSAWINYDQICSASSV